jgi:hypothetical protein
MFEHAMEASNSAIAEAFDFNAASRQGYGGFLCYGFITGASADDGDWASGRHGITVAETMTAWMSATFWQGVL